MKDPLGSDFFYDRVREHLLRNSLKTIRDRLSTKVDKSTGEPSVDAEVMAFLTRIHDLIVTKSKTSIPAPLFKVKVY